MGLSSWSLDHIAFSWRVIPKAFRIKDPWESWNYQSDFASKRPLCDRALFQVYPNFVLPHASLRQPLLVHEPTKGHGSAKQWWSRTPAMAAGLPDHVWSLKEVPLFRVPPWSQPQTI